MPSKENTYTSLMTNRMPDVLLERLRRYQARFAYRDRPSRSALVNEALERFLDKFEGQKTSVVKAKNGRTYTRDEYKRYDTDAKDYT